MDFSSCTGIAHPSLTKLEYYVNIGILSIKSVCWSKWGDWEKEEKKKKVFEIYFPDLWFKEYHTNVCHM